MKILKIGFWIGISLSAIFGVISFLSWNNFSSSTPYSYDQPIERWHVDYCSISDSSLIISGWSVNLTDSLSRIAVYVKSNDGSKYIKIRSTITLRPDVVKTYNLNNEFIKSGFEAALRNIKSKGGLSNKVLIISQGSNGVNRGSTYECK